MTVPRLIIAGLELPYQSDSVSQTWERIGGFTATPRRMANGASLTQHRWERIRTTISCQHHTPPGLAAMDWTQTFILACIFQRAVQSLSNVITLPTARRNDVAPYGFAVTAGGLQVPTPGSLAGNVLTLTAVAGAGYYKAIYYPILTVTAPAGLNERQDQVGLVIGWELTAEEI